MLEKLVKSQLEVAQGELQTDPNSEENKATLDKALYQLKDFEEKKTYDLNRRSRVKWLKKKLRSH
jgi:hypothetical protein